MTEKEVITGMTEGKIFTHPDWDEGAYVEYDKNCDLRFIFRAPNGDRGPIQVVTWEDIASGEMVEYVPPIPDETPVWSWGNDYVSAKVLKLWDARNKTTFDYDGDRKGSRYTHIQPIYNLEDYPQDFQDMVAEMQSHLED